MQYQYGARLASYKIAAYAYDIQRFMYGKINMYVQYWGQKFILKN